MLERFLTFFTMFMLICGFCFYACDFADDCRSGEDCNSETYERGDENGDDDDDDESGDDDDDESGDDDDDDDDDDELVCGEALTCCDGNLYPNTCCGADGSQSTGPCDDEDIVGCPPARSYDGPCAQAIVWALNPDDGSCCNYGDMCSAPEDWEIFYNEEECLGD